MKFSSILIATVLLVGCAKSGDTTVPLSADGRTTIKADEQAGTMEVKTKDAVATLGGEETVTESDLKLAFYPGSSEVKGSSMKVKSAKGDMYMCVRNTDDSVEKVTEFYSGKVKDFKTFSGSATGTAYLTGKADDGVKVAIQLSRVKDKTMITITKSTK